MSDPPDDTAETPIQRALRLKQAAVDARPKPPRGGKFQRQQTAAELGIQVLTEDAWLTLVGAAPAPASDATDAP